MKARNFFYNAISVKCAGDVDKVELNKYLDIVLNTVTEAGYVEKHHILPKALFKDCADLRTNEWNCSVLSAEDHLRAHIAFYKATGLLGNALYLMAGKVKGLTEEDVAAYGAARDKHNAEYRGDKHVAWKGGFFKTSTFVRCDGTINERALAKQARYLNQLVSNGVASTLHGEFVVAELEVTELHEVADLFDFDAA